MSDQIESPLDWYEQQSFLPTFGGFETDDDLAAHERYRRRLFTEKLLLPPRLFAGSRLLEFGPDAGENALAFARWGATCTLAEPHRRAHPVIVEYFDRFGLTPRLDLLTADDVDSFPVPPPDGRFDFVDAEGFLNMVQPISGWIEKLAAVAAPGGFVILFEVTRPGCALELLWKVVHHRFRSLTGASPLEAADSLFTAKWASIPHKRSMSAWVMDVLENPFVRLPYCLDPAALCAAMVDAGFRLYSSWPRYDSGLDVHWFKTEESVAAQLERQTAFLAQSRLTHLFSRRLFLTHPSAEVESLVESLVSDLDHLIDGFPPDRVEELLATLSRIGEVVGGAGIVATPEDRRATQETIGMIRSLLDVLGSEEPEAIAAFCANDSRFIRTWGNATHFLVFERRAAD